MKRTWTMPGANGALHVVRSADGCRRGAAGAGAFSEATLQAWLADPVSRPAVLQMFEATTGFPAAAVGVAEPDLRRRVVAELGRAFKDARLVAEIAAPSRSLRPFEAWGPGRRHGDHGGAAARPVAPASEGESTRRRHREPDPKKTWIEIVLLDDDGEPVANERCRLALPDGSVRVHTLDARGRLRLDGIEPGACEVSFPDRDARDWRSE